MNECVQFVQKKTRDYSGKASIKTGSDDENLLNLCAEKYSRSFFSMSSMIRHEFDLISIFLYVCADTSMEIMFVVNSDKGNENKQTKKCIRTFLCERFLCAGDNKSELKLRNEEISGIES